MEIVDAGPEKQFPELAEPDRALRFRELLDEHHREAAGSVHDLLGYWQSLRGRLDYGRGKETGCQLAYGHWVGRDRIDIYPLIIYPVSGRAEVEFGYL
jgi:hypothetical protein